MHKQLYILHFSEGAEKLQVYTDKQERDDHWDWFGTAHGEEYQATIHKYDCPNTHGFYEVLCHEIGADHEYSLWFISIDL